MAVVQPYLSIYTLNINELNFPVKRYRMAEWIKKEKKKYPSVCGQQGLKDTHRLRWKDGKRSFMQLESTNSWVATHISDKTNFKAKTAVREKGDVTNDKNINPTGYNSCKYLCT